MYTKLTKINHVAMKVGAMITSFGKEMAVARKSPITRTALIHNDKFSFHLFVIGWGKWGFYLELEHK